MEDNFDDIKKKWSKVKTTSTGISAEEMLKTAQNSIAKSKSAHIGNIAVLTATLAAIAAFFYFIAPMEDTISRVGIGLMTGGLLIRILIEIVSQLKARKISYTEDTLSSTKQAGTFYNWRKKIHGPVTITIVILYTIGFYIQTPEFLRHLELKWVYLMDFSYLIIAVVLFYVIRRGVVDEMRHLRSLKEMQDSFKI